MILTATFLRRLQNCRESIVWLALEVVTSRVVISVVIVGAIVAVLVVALVIVFIIVILTLVAIRLESFDLPVFFTCPCLYHDLERFDINGVSSAKVLEHPTVMEAILKAVNNVMLRGINDCGLLIEEAT